jgi:DNA (cytosine-5)-methyltransferase 1
MSISVGNFYAGLGGNSMLWQDDNVTAYEHTGRIATQYEELHPSHQVECEDAHEALLNHAQDYEFVWSSPPCQSRTRMIRSGKNRKPRYVDCTVEQEVLFLMHDYEGLWLVENVQSWFEPLIQPTIQIGRHSIWTNLDLGSVIDVPRPANFINQTTIAGMRALQDWLGMHYEQPIYYDGNHCPAQVLRNCVHPEIGLQILNIAKEQS